MNGGSGGSDSERGIRVYVDLRRRIVQHPDPSWASSSNPQSIVAKEEPYFLELLLLRRVQKLKRA